MTTQKCQSTSHKVPEHCHGGLWQCGKCKKWVCLNDGSADRYPNLCDACWHEQEKNQKIFLSVRVVRAGHYSEAQEKVQDGEFDEQHILCDKIYELDELKSVLVRWHGRIMVKNPLDEEFRPKLVALLKKELEDSKAAEYKFVEDEFLVDKLFYGEQEISQYFSYDLGAGNDTGIEASTFLPGLGSLTFDHAVRLEDRDEDELADVLLNLEKDCQEKMRKTGFLV